MGLRALVVVGIAGLVWAVPSGLSGVDRTIAIDYPENGSIFPPEITAPTFLWRDPGGRALEWRIEVSFADGSPAIRTVSRGWRLRVGRIDPDCVSETNELPELTARQAAEHTWKPDAAMWERIKEHSRGAAATVTISGLCGPEGKTHTGSNACATCGRSGTEEVPRVKPALLAALPRCAASCGRVTIRTSKDPVGAPIFYRDVPLMPTETEKGVIKPLAQEAVRLIAWRLRNIGEPRSRVVMDHVPVCANCHSFSADGKTLGMDLDGLQNNKGLYTLTHVAPETSIGNRNVIQWRTAEGRLKSPLRVGFMSQVSPDGQYVVTTVDPRDDAKSSNYYVSNFLDYRFLQVFYPTRGILMWYSRATARLQPLPGADDPRFVQMGAVWSPDGKYLVFLRAEAKDPDPPGLPPAKFANDPNELQIRYGLWRIPFNGGKGGTPEPVAGASRDGMSNSFPKVSPDGRWIVFVKARNGMLMRPDSQLYIVPAAGGEARRMRANTSRMNSWHSFSPNGRWLVFSSKARSPYTQMYLTHIDEEGNDSPAILIDNTTAANRAVNLPEFVNIPPDGLVSIGGPAVDFYRRFDRAMYLQNQKRFEEAAAEWRDALALKPDDELARGNLAAALLMVGRREEAGAELKKAQEIQLRKAIENRPSAPLYDSLGSMMLDAGRTDEGVAQFEKAVELEPRSAPARTQLGKALAKEGHLDEALAQLRQAAGIDPRYAPAHSALAGVLNRKGMAEEAIGEWRKALEIDANSAEAHAGLGGALYGRGEYREGIGHLRKAAELMPGSAAALREAAWALATCRDPLLRNGAEAVALAVRALQLSGGKDAAVLDTLAAAYAAKQQFADAVLTARRALSVAEQGRQQNLTAAIRGRLARYEVGRE